MKRRERERERERGSPTACGWSTGAVFSAGGEGRARDALQESRRSHFAKLRARVCIYVSPVPRSLERMSN